MSDEGLNGAQDARVKWFMLDFFNKCSIIQWEWGCLGADNRGEGGFGKVDF